MALETWLVKVKSKISNTFDSVPKPKLLLSISNNNTKKLSSSSSNVGVLAFEVASIMSKLLHLWQALSDKNIIRLRNDSISLVGVRKIVSNDESFLLGLAFAEFVDNTRAVAKAVSRLSKRCEDSNLKSFDGLFELFANSGHDSLNWVLSLKEMEARSKKMDRYVVVTATLYKEMEELSVLENGLKKVLMQSVAEPKYNEYEASVKEEKILNLQQNIMWQRQEVKYLKERSLWNRSFDTVVSILTRPIFTVLARIKHVFGYHPAYNLPRSLSSTSATVHPTEVDHLLANGFFETSSKMLKPPPETTLGAAALALHYANLIIVMEKMIKSPQLVGVDARDDVYAMLPSSIRSLLRARLNGVGLTAASDPAVLAGEWRDALGRILNWLSPLAHNMIKWQCERSFDEQKNLGAKNNNNNNKNNNNNNNVLLLQTLYFANKEKTEAAITELLVGLNYIWRFEREMTAKALFECDHNFNGLLNFQNSK